ncbi:hypothetical protein BMS3Bbin12_00889 [bacterium BMS3Bbin12]|nr:hypothetical protein BMS3Abin12_00283 [bacterium BMS3Abin12]GBE47725.1 hypothetical protein BMS3Bbin12_00889 [bacterium BMS3Bbin12]GBE49923.1 hypothetical protein BMS3Bbin13_00848 [bacterium BMS3Bbin13]
MSLWLRVQGVLNKGGVLFIHYRGDSSVGLPVLLQVYRNAGTRRRRPVTSPAPESDEPQGADREAPLLCTGAG